MPKHSSQHLDDAYDVRTAEETRALYSDWASSYEKDLLDNGYVTPERCAVAMAALAEDLGRPVLDLGCGTGLSGAALKLAGFEIVDGTDFSAEMLAVAEQKAGVYRRLIQGDLENPLPGKRGDYACLSAVGVLNPGHAPASMIAQVMDHLEPGGLFVFSLNDHCLKDPEYQGAIDALAEDGVTEVAFEEYGIHIPGMELKSKVFVLRKL